MSDTLTMNITQCFENLLEYVLHLVLCHLVVVQLTGQILLTQVTVESCLNRVADCSLRIIVLEEYLSHPVDILMSQSKHFV